MSPWVRRALVAALLMGTACSDEGAVYGAGPPAICDERDLSANALLDLPRQMQPFSGWNSGEMSLTRFADKASSFPEIRASISDVRSWWRAARAADDPYAQALFYTVTGYPTQETPAETLALNEARSNAEKARGAAKDKVASLLDAIDARCKEDQ